MKTACFIAWVVLASFVGRVGYAQPAATAGAEPVPGRAVSLPRTPDVVYVPTPQYAVDKMLELAEIKPGDVVYDLGCGDGRIVVTAAKKYGVKAVGIDIDPQRVKESWENVRANKLEKLVTIKQADIFAEDLSQATVITLYLLPSLNVKLIPQLEKLKPGTRILSYQFAMGDVKPKQTFSSSYTIYKWVTPLERAKP